MSLVGALLPPWLPAVLVAILGVLALAAAATPNRRAAARWLRPAALAVIGSLAVAATVWQASAASDRIARLLQQDRTKELEAQVRSLEQHIAKLEESTRIRSLDPGTATKLADYLRPLGSHQVIVSCVPNDIEAYRYATQIADVLKAANWDARGPETTTMFGDVKAMGINLYNNGGQPSDTVKILLEALAKFGVPYQSRVPPSEALPESDAVELFIGSKPGQPGATTAATPH